MKGLGAPTETAKAIKRSLSSFPDNYQRLTDDQIGKLPYCSINLLIKYAQLAHEYRDWEWVVYFQKLILDKSNLSDKRKTVEKIVKALRKQKKYEDAQRFLDEHKEFIENHDFADDGPSFPSNHQDLTLEHYARLEQCPFALLEKYLRNALKDERTHMDDISVLAYAFLSRAHFITLEDIKSIIWVKSRLAILYEKQGDFSEALILSKEVCSLRQEASRRAHYAQKFFDDDQKTVDRLEKLATGITADSPNTAVQCVNTTVDDYTLNDSSLSADPIDNSNFENFILSLETTAKNWESTGDGIYVIPSPKCDELCALMEKFEQKASKMPSLPHSFIKCLRALLIDIAKRRRVNLAQLKVLKRRMPQAVEITLNV